MPLKTTILCSNYSVRVTRTNSTHTLSIYTLYLWTSKAGTSGRIDWGDNLFLQDFLYSYSCVWMCNEKACILYSHCKLPYPLLGTKYTSQLCQPFFWSPDASLINEKDPSRIESNHVLIWTFGITLNINKYISLPHPYSQLTPNGNIIAR